MFLKEVSAFRECLNKKILMKMDIMIKSTIKNIKFATTDCLTSFIFITDCLTFFFCPLPPVLFLEKVLKVTPLLQKYFNFLYLQDSKGKSKNVFLFKLVPDNKLVVTKLEIKCNSISIFFILMHFTFYFLRIVL